MKTRKYATLQSACCSKSEDERKCDKSSKEKEECKDSSYRETHNIGRRKSNDSVVTYSLNSHLFFDVYAKFDQQNMGYLNGGGKTARSPGKTPKSPSKKEISLDKNQSFINGASKLITRSSSRRGSSSEVETPRASPLKENILHEIRHSPNNKTGKTVSANALTGERGADDVDKRRTSMRSQKKCDYVKEMKPCGFEEDCLQDNVVQMIGSGKSRRISQVLVSEGEGTSPEGCKTPRSSPRKSRTSVNPTISSSSSLQGSSSPFKSPCKKRMRKSSLQSHHSSIAVEESPTNTETFLHLLKKETVFNKHPSKEPSEKLLNNTKVKRKESRIIRKNVKKLKYLKNCEDRQKMKMRSTTKGGLQTFRGRSTTKKASQTERGGSTTKKDSHTERGESSTKEHSQKTFVKDDSGSEEQKPKRIKRIKSVPIRNKRVASLNAAAIINCVQGLLENGDNDRNKTSVKGDMTEDDEEIMLELVTEQRPVVEEKGESFQNPKKTTNQVEEILEKKNSADRRERNPILEPKIQSEMKKPVTMEEDQTSKPVLESQKKNEHKPNNDILSSEIKVTKRNYGRFFDIMTTGSQKDAEKIVPLSKKGTCAKKEEETNQENLCKRKVVSEGKEFMLENLGKETSNKKSKCTDILKSAIKIEEICPNTFTNTLSQNKKKKSGNKGLCSRKELEMDKTGLVLPKDEGACKNGKIIIFNERVVVKKPGKKEIDEKNILLEKVDEMDSLWNWEGESMERPLFLQTGSDMLESRTWYGAIRHAQDDVVINVMDCVMLRSVDDQEPYVAKIIAFFFDQVTGKKMMQLLWYYRPEHTELGRLAWHTDADVYASKHVDINSVDCIDDKAFVLPIELYCRFISYQKRVNCGTRQGITARMVPTFPEEKSLTKIEDPGISTLELTMDMFASDFYYTSNFQSLFLPEMTTANVFVCRGLYDIHQRRIVVNVLQVIQSPVNEPQCDHCVSVDSAMSISSCDSDFALPDHHSLLDIPLPPNGDLMRPKSYPSRPLCHSSPLPKSCAPSIPVVNGEVLISSASASNGH